jgi:hypothetical protein
MKSKFTVKILGTLVVLAMLASLIVGLTASPASAAAGTLAWGSYTTPSNAGYLLGGYSNLLSPAATIGNPVINLVAASPTGSEIFGLDSADETLYSSTNGGASWSEVAVTGITDPVAFVVSPNFKTDNSMVIASATGVWISTNAGGSFTMITPTLGTETITSLDLGYWFTTGNVLTAIVGLANAGGAPGDTAYGSNVIDYTYGAFGWKAVGAMADSVYGVKISPAGLTDGEAMCVYYAPAGALCISSDFGSLGWGTTAYPDNVIVGVNGTMGGSAVATALTAPPTSVEMATATDYVGNTGASVFVGISGLAVAANNGVYKVSGRANSGGSTVAEGLTGNVTSLAVSGPIATATVFAGIGAGISYSTTATASTPTWSGSAGLGTITSADVAVAGSMVVAGTMGGTDGGILVSTNLGASFQGVGALNTGNPAVLDVSLVNFQAANATTWFVTMTNGSEDYVFMTTNGGTSWMRIYSEMIVAPATTLMVTVSTAYTTDSTVAISDGTSLLHVSNNGGMTFSNVGSAATTISSIFAINASNIFAGTTGGTYKVGSFAQGATDGTAITSFALSPMDKTLATFLVGQADGTVWQTTNNGGTFTELGAAPGTGAAMVAYGPDGTVYAAEGTSVFSWSSTASAWSNLGLTLTKVAGIAVGTNNVLYVTDTKAAVNGTFVWRSVNPNQENTTAGGAPTFNSMNFGTVSGTALSDNLSSMAVLTATAGDTVLVMDTTAPVTSGVAGCLEGFLDTMAVAPTKLVPANNAVVSFPGATPSVTLGWAAVTGATGYQVVVNGGTPVTVTTNSYTFTANPGSAYTWSVYVYGVGTTAPASTFLGLSSPTLNFTTALSAIPVAPAVLNPPQGATNVPLSGFNFVWPADQTDLNAGLTVTYQFALAQASANTSANEFAILDYSDNTATNAETLQETLQPNAVYWWEVRSVAMNGSGGIATYGAWQVNTFTTGPAMTSTTVAPPVTVTQTNVTITQTQPPMTTVQSTVTSLVVTQAASTQAIPAYLLWIVIVIGAILVIAVIVLIVRTRRIP